MHHLLDGSFMPHGHCLLWRPDLLLMHVGGDVATSAAYFIIPSALVYLVRRRDDLAFDWIFVMFAAFIFCCGVTHVLEIVNIWEGYYYVEGVAKLATGAVSLATAGLVWRLMPQALSLPSRRELLDKNEALQRAEAELRQANTRLEMRVAERTQELEQLAVTDALTGLSNRRELMRRLDSELDRVRRYPGPFSVLMIDLDDFKRVNDQHGHLAGDAVLAAAAERFVAQARSTDIVGRYGGEEFLCILPATSASNARQLAERLRAAADAARVDTDGGPVRFTCSIGVAEHKPGERSHDVLQRADQALYAAKRQGKNRTVVAD